MGSGGTGGGTAGPGVSRPVKVYDEKGKVVSVDVLKKNDLLVVYWKGPHSFDGSITQDIQGTSYHSSLLVFEKHNPLNSFSCQSVCGDAGFYWFDVDKVYIVGHDSTGRTLLFVRELNERRTLAERRVEQMHKKIDALKA